MNLRASHCFLSLLVFDSNARVRGQVTLLIGDLALLHDVGSLHACARAAADQLGVPVPPITIVVVNNGGGGIFSFLPVPKIY
jgi:2-succinyl-5-enolpyruvyl-6-hydroxy-3-cyclohexene-1-carboxylate synthase